MTLRKLIELNKPKLPDCKPVIEKIEKELKKNRVEAEVVVGGSAAKNTYLKTFDLDIFVRFKNKADPDLLEVILNNAFGKSRVSRLHGSRDYFQISVNGQGYEIVPVLKITKATQAKNITDVSMLHVEWVLKNLKNPDDVRLAKLFMKAHNLYGAESYISGFSGYIVEILIAHYGNFLKMIEAVANWKSKTIIDVANHYKNKNDLIMNLNKSKQVSPLIIIDPVDKNRNAAAAVSPEKYAQFIYAAQEFLKKPSESGFTKQKFSISNIKKEAKMLKAKLIILKFNLLKGKSDVVCSKALKTYEFFAEKLRSYDFEILKSGVEIDENIMENIMWFIVLPERLPEFAKVQGPQIWVDKKNLDQFIAKHHSVFLDGDKLAALRKRRFVDAKSLFEFLIKDNYVRERVDRVKIV